MFLNRLWHERAMAAVCLSLCFQGAALMNAKEVADPRGRIDIKSYVIDASLNPGTHQLEAKVKIQFAALESDISHLEFDFNANLSPAHVLDEKNRPVRFNQDVDTSKLSVDLDAPLSKPQEGSLVFEYHGTLNKSDRSPVEDVKLANIDEAGSYLLARSFWVPMNGYNFDRAAVQLNLTVPKGIVVVSQGKLTGVDKGAREDVFHWQADGQQFPFTVAAGKYVQTTVQTESIPVTLYLSESNAKLAKDYGEMAGKIIEFYNTRFSLYPFASYSIAEIDDSTVGGYSAPGLTLLARRTLSTKVNYRLLAHEIGHQWWGLRLNPRFKSDYWLSEGFASYSAALFMENYAGEGAYEDEMKDLSIKALVHESAASISNAGRLTEETDEYRSVVQYKGAVVLHMLRYLIGDTKFSTALQTFATKFAYQPVTTADFKSVVEQVTAQDLTYFFAEWVLSTGAPDFRLKYTVFRTQKGFRVQGHVEQDMDTLRMPVEVSIETQGKPESKTVELSGTSSDFEIETFGQPVRVDLDPHHRLLRYDAKTRILTAIQRGKELYDQGEYVEAVDAYKKALDLDKHNSLAHFRIGEAFLAQRNYNSAANAFREALNGDLDPKWVEVFSHINLGKVYDALGQRERAVQEYRKAIDTNDNTQGAQEEARKYMAQPYKESADEFK
ncbi:MAG: tetratricopeptide repeat protein [Acidobacteriia bacterium]|nr:tetratricopeptide repeat protein [Terriglobia bacterium]